MAYTDINLNLALDLDPTQFNKTVTAYEDTTGIGGKGGATYLESSDGLLGEDDLGSSDIEKEFDEFDGGFKPHRTKDEWQKLVDDFCRPSSLKLQGDYKLEKEDSKHRMGDLLASALELYKKSNSPKPFYEWLDSIPEYQRIVMISDNLLMRLKHKKNANLSPSMVKAFIRGVKYLDSTGRKRHRVKFVGGTAMMNDAPFSTVEMQTVFSGRGFGIWVMSKDGKMYAGSHVKGQQHHSTFLEGGKVMCGGEVYAENGVIKFLSAKTGHYQASLSHLVWALKVLEISVSNFDQITVLVWSNGKPVLASTREILLKYYMYDAWGQLNSKVKSALQSRQFKPTTA